MSVVSERLQMKQISQQKVVALADDKKSKNDKKSINKSKSKKMKVDEEDDDNDGDYDDQGGEKEEGEYCH